MVDFSKLRREMLAQLKLIYKKLSKLEGSVDELAEAINVCVDLLSQFRDALLGVQGTPRVSSVEVRSDCEDILLEAGLDFSLADLRETIAFVMSNPELKKQTSIVNGDPLFFILRCSLDPNITRIFSYLKKTCMSEGRALTHEEADFLEKIVALRNVDKDIKWTLEVPNIGEVIVTSQYDTFSGKRGGHVKEVLMPAIPQVSTLRGLVKN